MITIIFRFDQLKVLKLTVKAGILCQFSKIAASPQEPGTNAFVTQTESPVREEVVCHRFRFQLSTKMPRRCVVFGCSEVANSEKGISVHVIPYFEDNRPVSVRHRKRWVDFVTQEHGRTGGIPNLPQSVRSISLLKISSDALPLISCLVSRENF